MKVGVVTFHQAFNYGAVLQAYASIETLRRLGHEPQLIDYWMKSDTARDASLFNRGRSLRTLITNLLIATHYPAIRRKYLRFNNFRQDYLPLTRERYASYEDLQQTSPECDAYITGSDQVWNPTGGLDPVLFLEFAREAGKPRIAYAPSFGVPDVPAEYREQCAEWLRGYHALSCRERRGSELVRDLTGLEAKTTADPVLLLTGEEWCQKLALTSEVKEPYIFVYAVRTRKALKRVVANLKAESGLPVVLVTGENPANRLGIPADEVVWDAGPREFLQLAAGAACICTPSFHGTAFSLVFRKPFYAIQHTSGDSRMRSLAELTGLTGQLVESENFVLPSNPLELDYSAATEAIERLRQSSVEYLQTALDRAK